MEVDRHERFLEQGERLSGAQIRFAESRQRYPPDLYRLLERRYWVVPVVPEVGTGIGCARGPGVFIGEEIQIPLQARLHDRLEHGRFSSAVRKLAVGPLSRVQVPLADADSVGFREIERALAGDPHQRSGIVHDRRPAVGTGGEVVREPQRMSDLVGRELPDARQSEHDRVVAPSATALAGPRQPLEEQAVLAHA